VPILLGILVAASFGSGDFLGGLASRRSTMLSVLAIAQCTAFLGAIVYASVAGGNASGRDIVLGASAGGVNVLALGALYAGLATGRMGIVAPVTAVVAAFIPVLWGFATGETLSTVTLVGVIVAIAAGGLVASARDTGDRHATGRSVALAVFSGVFFGASLIIYSETSHGSGAWPVFAGRTSAVIGVLIVALLARRTLRIAKPDRRLALAAGVLDVTATALALVAVHEGVVAVVAPVSSLGPAFTVICAWFVLREPVARVQVAGLVAALAGLVLIAAG
jgi:drug/metabolite transporter (DMT)-like permease